MSLIPRIRRTCLIAVALAGLTLSGSPSAQASRTGFDAVKTYESQPLSVVAPADGEAWVSSKDANGGTTLDHYADGRWTRSVVADVPNGRLVSGAADDVWLFGNNALEHYDGSSWASVELPSGPDGATLSPTAVADVPGADAYVAFSYFSFDSPYAVIVAHWDGTTWSQLPWPFQNGDAESIEDLAYVDNGLVARFYGYRGITQYINTYTRDGGWTPPVAIGSYVAASGWFHDWVVDGLDDVWLYGEGEDLTGIIARCGRFDGASLDTDHCVAGPGRSVEAATRMPDGRHLIGSSEFTMIQQPDRQSAVSSIGVTRVTDLAAEPSSGVAWAIAQRPDDYALLRYGAADDVSQFVVQAQGSRSQVERGDVLSITGTVYPAVASPADRRVVLQVWRAGGWSKVAADRTSADGTFRFDVEQSATGAFRYRVFKPAVAGTGIAAYSPDLTVTVIKPFSVTISGPKQVHAGKKAVITGKVTPKITDPQQRGVVLQVKSGSAWRTVTTTTTSASGSYRFEVVKTGTGTFRYRVEKTAAGIRSDRYSRAIDIKVVR